MSSSESSDTRMGNVNPHDDGDQPGSSKDAGDLTEKNDSQARSSKGVINLTYRFYEFFNVANAVGISQLS